MGCSIIIYYFFLCIDLAFFTFGVLGNSVVIYVIHRERVLKSKLNYLVLSVATCDLIIGLIGIPLGLTAALTGEPRNFKLCVLGYSILMSFFKISIFSLVAVSFDRFLAICYPLIYQTKSSRFIKTIIAVCWISGFILGFLPFFGWNSGKLNGSCFLPKVASFSYTFYITACIDLVSALIIAVFYFLIYREIVSNKNHQEIISNTSEVLKKRREIRAAKTLGLIVGTFLLAWMPGVLSVFVVAITENRNFSKGFLELSAVLLHFNITADPLIYAFRMKKVREAMKRVFRFKISSKLDYNKNKNEIVNLRDC